MTHAAPNTEGKYPVEPKVKYGSIAMYVAGVVLMAIIAVFTENDNALLLDVLPDAVEVFVVPLIPTLVGFATAWASQHQYRAPEVGGSSPPTHLG